MTPAQLAALTDAQLTECLRGARRIAKAPWCADLTESIEDLKLERRARAVQRAEWIERMTDPAALELACTLAADALEAVDGPWRARVEAVLDDLAAAARTARRTA